MAKIRGEWLDSVILLRYIKEAFDWMKSSRKLFASIADETDNEYRKQYYLGMASGIRVAMQYLDHERFDEESKKEQRNSGR